VSCLGEQRRGRRRAGTENHCFWGPSLTLPSPLSLHQTRELFAEMGERLQKHKYLVGDSFTAADMTFAALAAPVLNPESYGADMSMLKEVRHPAGHQGQ
jgi:glutathione S-transferase